MPTTPSRPVSPAAARSPALWHSPAPLGFRLPPAGVPTVSWLPWQVVERTNGFAVSRESVSGTAREWVRNEVRKAKVFRKRELAQAACDKANRGAA
jgi:hypothetical protein